MSNQDRQDGDGLLLEVLAFNEIRSEAQRHWLAYLNAEKHTAVEPPKDRLEYWIACVAIAATKPTRDAAEGATPIGEDTPYWRTLRAALVLPVEEQYAIAKDLAANCGYDLTGDAYATPQPAPDAMRTACAKIATDVGFAARLAIRSAKGPRERSKAIGAEEAAQQIAKDIAVFSAPVPPADGAGEPFKTCPGCEMRRTCADMKHCYGPSHAELKERFALPPSATGAAEPAPDDDWEARSERSYIDNTKVAELPVRGDRTAINQAADEVVRRVGEYNDRTSPDDFPEALLITPSELHNELTRFADDLSLHVQPGAGERDSDAAEADRYFDLASEFGNQLQTLAGVVQDAVDILAERKHGNAARSPGHNARVILETALKSVSPSALPARQAPQSSREG